MVGGRSDGGRIRAFALVIDSRLNGEIRKTSAARDGCATPASSLSVIAFCAFQPRKTDRPTAGRGDERGRGVVGVHMRPTHSLGLNLCAERDTCLTSAKIYLL